MSLVVVRLYADVHLARQNTHRHLNVAPALPPPHVRIETDMLLPLAEAQRVVARGEGYYVKDEQGNILTA